MSSGGMDWAYRMIAAHKLDPLGLAVVMHLGWRDAPALRTDRGIARALSQHRSSVAKQRPSWQKWALLSAVPASGSLSRPCELSRKAARAGWTTQWASVLKTGRTTQWATVDHSVGHQRTTQWATREKRIKRKARALSKQAFRLLVRLSPACRGRLWLLAFVGSRQTAATSCCCGR